GNLQGTLLARHHRPADDRSDDGGDGAEAEGELMQERLQKLIAAAGVASRRKAEELILAGEVTVNGQVVTALGTKADPAADHIKVRGKLINAKLAEQEKIYLLLNKPLGYLTSNADPQGRQLVIDLLGKYRDKVHPVGR